MIKIRNLREFPPHFLPLESEIRNYVDKALQREFPTQFLPLESEIRNYLDNSLSHFQVEGNEEESLL